MRMPSKVVSYHHYMDIASGAAAALTGAAKKAIENKADDEKKMDKRLVDRAEKSGDLDTAAGVRAHRETVKQLIRLKMWQPIGRMVGISRDYFEYQLEDNIAKKLADVPEEDIITPKGSVAGPALTGVGMTVDEPELHDMYLNLLAAAANRKTEQRAHPSFAQVIGQINADEAKILSSILKLPACPIFEIRIKAEDGNEPGSYSVHQTNIPAWFEGNTRRTLVDWALA